MRELTKTFFKRYGVPNETLVRKLTDAWYRVEMMPERESCGVAITFSEWYVDGTSFSGHEDEFPEGDFVCAGVEHLSDGYAIPHFYTSDAEGAWVRYKELGTGETERWVYDG